MQAPGGEIRFGPFRLLQPLGGGMAVVYRARRDGDASDVAIKLLRRDRLLDGEARERFARERRVLVHLQHPGICPVIETGEVDSMPFLCMPLLAGRPLSAWIESAVQAGGELELPGGTPDAPPWRRIVEVLAKAADAVQFAHAAGFCHRDIKPGNLWIDPSGEPILLDFGLASENADRLHHLTRTGQIVGTPAYLAPEQIDSRLGQVDGRADVYGLCAVLYEALTLVTPFRAGSRAELFREILGGFPADPRRFRPHLPEALVRVLEAGMARNRNERYTTPAALAADLRAVCRGAKPAMRPRPLWLRISRRLRRHASVLTTAAACSLALGLFAASLGDVAQAAERAQQRLAGDRIGLWLGRLELAKSSYRELPPPLPEHREAFADWIAQHGEPLLTAPVEARAGLPDIEPFARRAVADARQRLECAANAQRQTIDDHADAWRRAREEVGADSRFEGFRLVPQPGLVPLGADPDSGLQEFYDVASGAPELSPPRRDAARHLQFSERHGIVFILVPGGPFRPLGSTQIVEMQPFLLAKHEMTRAQHRRLDQNDDPSVLPLGPLPGYEDQTLRHAVNMLLRRDVRELLRRWGMQLPTVAQWQRAALGGSDEDAPRMPGNFAGDEDGFHFGAPVGSYAPNLFGFLDILGNHDELVADTDGSQGQQARPGDGLRGTSDDRTDGILVGGSYGAPRWRISDSQAVPADQRFITSGVRPMRSLLQ